MCTSRHAIDDHDMRRSAAPELSHVHIAPTVHAPGRDAASRPRQLGPGALFHARSLTLAPSGALFHSPALTRPLSRARLHARAPDVRSHEPHATAMHGSTRAHRYIDFTCPQLDRWAAVTPQLLAAPGEGAHPVPVGSVVPV